MSLSRKFLLSPDVMTQLLGDEMVLLDLNSGAYFALDEVGSRIWQLMGEGKNLHEIGAVLNTEYETSLEELERDTEKLAEELMNRRLIRLV